MLILLIILLLISIGSIIYILIFKKNEKVITEQLNEIVELETTNMKIQHMVNLPGSGEMVNTLNELIKRYKEDELKFREKTAEYQSEILNISHDLRTPLTSMKGFVDLVSDESTSDEQRSEYLDIIRGKIEVLENLVEAFYEISLMDSGDFEIKLEKVSINKLLSEVLLAFYMDFEMSGLVVEVDISEEDAHVLLDRRLTIRILTNIIQNILKYGKSTCRISSISGKGETSLVFENDLEEESPLTEDVSLAYNKSYTADTSRTRGSLGLGLYIAKKLTETQGGEIALEISSGVFRVTLSFKELADIGCLTK